MKKSHIFLLVVLSVLALSVKVSACSVSINDLRMKNTLVSEVASEFNISFEKVSSVRVTGYDKEFVGVVPGSSCEQFLDISAQVSLSYSPNIFQRCELTVNVLRREDLHAESFPIETYTFSMPASSCSTISPVLVRPVKPIRHIGPGL
jgi:hypothetical protein